MRQQQMKTLILKILVMELDSVEQNTEIHRDCQKVRVEKVWYLKAYNGNLLGEK